MQYPLPVRPSLLGIVGLHATTPGNELFNFTFGEKVRKL